MLLVCVLYCTTYSEPKIHYAGDESSWERKFLRAKVLMERMFSVWNFRSRERKCKERKVHKSPTPCTGSADFLCTRRCVRLSSVAYVHDKRKTARRLNRNIQTAHEQRTYQLPAVLLTGRRSSQIKREQQESLQNQRQRRNKWKLLDPTSSRLLKQSTPGSYWCRHCQQLQVKTWQVLADNIRYGTISRCFSPMTQVQDIVFAFYRLFLYTTTWN